MTNQNFDFESLATNFLSADKTELMNFSKSNGFSFAEAELLYIQSHLRFQKKALPTYNQLNFFNQISLIRQQIRQDYSISSASTNADASVIMQTARDLLEKKKVLQKKKSSDPMSLCEASNIASEYLRYIDCAENNGHFLPYSQAENQQYCIHTGNKPIFSLAEPKDLSNLNNAQAAPTNSEKTAIAVLTPTKALSKDEYLEKALAFFSVSDVKPHVGNYKIVNTPFGLFDFLLKEKDGISVNLANLPQTKKNEIGRATDISDILYACKDSYIFELNPLSIPYLSFFSSSLGLTLSVFAIRNFSKLFTLEKATSPAFCFRFDFLSTLTKFQDARPYALTDEASEPIGCKNPIFLTDKKANPPRAFSAESILSFTKNIASATSRITQDSPYKTSAIATLDAINALVAKGISKSSISLSIHYTLLSGTDDPSELGKNFAMILGAYRTMLELCVADSRPQIEYSKNQRSIAVVASSKHNARKVKSAFGNKESLVYFLPIRYDSYGLPDYQKYRFSNKLFFILLENDAVLSSFTVNENMANVISNAAKGAYFEYSDTVNIESADFSRGILFETHEELSYDDLIFVGKNIPITQNEG